ncbi:MAG: hypothetical protein EXR74_08740 [Bdellovibrionales bacterium]|nr:hypothetical protein [Bdellovibrionales bacterium]
MIPTNRLFKQSFIFIIFALSFSAAFANSTDMFTRGEVEFPLDFNLQLNLKSFAPDTQLKYRYHSFGNTRLKIVMQLASSEIDSRENLSIEVTPEILNNNSSTLILYPKKSHIAGEFTYELFLKQPGTYWLLPSKSQKTWKVSCLAGCGRKEVSINELVSSLNSEEKTYFIQKITKFLRLKFPQIEGSELIVEKLITGITEQGLNSSERFPILPPIFELNDYRKLLLLVLGKDNNYDTNNLPGSWSEIIEQFTFNSRPQPKPVTPELPNIKYGHFISESVPLKMVTQNYAVAAVMTKLAEQNGYSLRFPTAHGSFVTVTNLEEFLQVLWHTGHHIELRDDRTFANFISFTYGEQYIRWPVWFHTAVVNEQNEELIFPAPHSQFVWQITGPIVNARVNFFLGIYGLNFFPKLDEERPQWTGFTSKIQITDETLSSKASIKKATHRAGVYLRRVRQEAALYSKDYPIDGYGFIGICNDSSAIVESAISETTSFYPLFRSAQLGELSKVYDGLEGILSRLPNDSVPIGKQGLNREESSVFFSRILNMVSYPYDPNFRWNETFFQQVERLRSVIP